MSEFLQIMSSCSDLRPVINFIKDGIMPIIQFGIPIILIVLGSIDLGKAVMSSDEKEMKGATGKLMKRVIAAVVIFFIPWLVNLVIGTMAKTSGDDVNTGDESWYDCWNE